MANKKTNDSSNVSAGKPKVGGALFMAPLGTAVPTDAKTPLDEAFTCLGYATEDGLQNSVEADEEKFKAWGGDVVLVSQTSHEESFTFSLMEIDEHTLKLAFGADNVTVESDGSIKVLSNSKEKPKYVFVFETLLSNNRVQRIVVPKGNVGSSWDVTYTDGEIIAYELTVSALPDTDGNKSIRYISKIVSA